MFGWVGWSLARYEPAAASRIPPSNWPRTAFVVLCFGTGTCPAPEEPVRLRQERHRSPGYSGGHPLGLPHSSPKKASRLVSPAAPPFIRCTDCGRTKMLAQFYVARGLSRPVCNDCHQAQERQRSA